MERKSNLSRPISTTTTAADSNLTSTSTSVSVSPPDFLRHINAAYKRHRPLGTLQANFPRASRVLVHRKEPSRSEIVDEKLTKTKLGFDPGKDRAVEVRANAAPAPGTVNMSPFGMQKGDAEAEAELIGDRNNASLETLSTHLMDVEFPSAVDAGVDFRFKSADARMIIDTKMDDLSSYLHSLALTEGEGQYSNQGTINDLDLKLHDVANVDLPGMGGANKIEKREDYKHNSHCLDAMIRSNTMGSSCATTMSIHSGPTFQCTRAPPPGHTGVSTYTSSEVLPNMMKDGDGQRHPQQSLHSGEAIVEKVDPKNASRLQSQVPSTNNPSSGVVMDISQPSKAEKAPRKKKYDPDVFFKVNGKLYQRLGKIGSGGSSEVHKVISSDCTVYALKKIKLKGRDYPTAYGFCQEIEYLNKLKGKSNIIQLIDYEVTDKTLLQEVLNGSMTIKEGRIKDDQYIYMVLEYGEIDLAHMLSHKWKEAESSNWKIDENWLRFYWQQMLEAVNTIHEERIVHSDLKPANFLLVRGSLKLIDFGIAKSILSDTTNIQRDAQVGTLNYMSPEAFMWNEQDDSGNTIKCGRPSDIWSLGCILYQMVYGKTPFADYKTFWAKFKIITDKNHEISYKPLPNPLLIDLMKHCLAWDRNERWRIPQLLQHPFLLPPFPIEMPPNLPNKLHYSFLLEKIGVFWNEPQVSRLCSELYEVICNLEKAQDGNTP